MMTLKVPEICLFQLERNEKVEELDIVRVKRDDMDHGVKAGSIGTIVSEHGGGWFTVEFGDDIKDSITDYLLEYHESDLEVIAAYKLMDEPGPVKDVYKP